MSAFDLAEPLAVVTGARCGIGRARARVSVRAGADAIGVGADPEKGSGDVDRDTLAAGQVVRGDPYGLRRSGGGT
ncbi:hypothetical protein AB0E67_11045 [Streptomyces sp. NPDC032161]|uniref:hypothetical protein n=1 Tax=unclassified Streptomyces TaxID=2593676 RepID=UPI0033CFFA1A